MSKPARPRKFGKRPCPVCGEKMELVSKGKTELEVCEAHGVWLDKGRLEALLAATKRFEGIRSRHAVLRAKARSAEESAGLGALLALLSN